MARRVNLDLRALFRRFARAEAKAFADAILRTAARSRPRKDGAPLGGSLPEQLRKASAVRVKRNGYVVRYSLLGQALTWFVRGTTHQRARPVSVEAHENELAEAVADEAARQFAEWDASERPKNA